MVAKNDSAMEITNDEFEDIINSNGKYKLVVVDFYAEWCMPCLMLSPVVEELAGQMEEVKFVKINVDDNQELASRYGVSSIPCLVIFKEGKEVGRMVGNKTGEEIEETVKGFLGQRLLLEIDKLESYVWILVGF